MPMPGFWTKMLFRTSRSTGCSPLIQHMLDVGFTAPASRLRDVGNYWIFKQEELEKM